jgi:hypothetical protein
MRVLLRGPFPPPYGGIATLLNSLIVGFKDSGAEDVAVLHYGTKNAVEKVEGATIYRFNLKTQIWKALLPQNWAILFMDWALHKLAGSRCVCRIPMLDKCRN